MNTLLLVMTSKHEKQQFLLMRSRCRCRVSRVISCDSNKQKTKYIDTIHIHVPDQVPDQ